MLRQGVRIRFPLGAAGAILLAARVAAAAPAQPSVELRYSAEDSVVGCHSEPTFRHAVRQRLPFDPFVAPPNSAPIVVTVRIDRSEPELRATITLTEPDGVAQATQELTEEHDGCATLSAAAALAVSLTIERSLVRAAERGNSTPAEGAPLRVVGAQAPTSQLLAPSPSGSPDNGQPPTPAVTSKRPPPGLPGSKRDVRNVIDVHTHAGGGIGLGILPAAAAGARAGATVELERWTAGVEAGAWLPAEASSPPGGGARARLVFLSGSVCGRHGRFFACGVASLGDLRAAGTEPLLSRSSGSTYVAFGGRAGLEVPLHHPFALVLYTGLIAPLVRTTLRIGDEMLWRAPLAGAELGTSIRITIL